MKYEPALLRLVHWTELFKPVGYFVFLTIGLALFPLPFWATFTVGLVVGATTFFRERWKWVRDTPQCIELTASGITITEKLSVPQSIQWSAVRKVTSDDELGGWQIETADRVLRFGVAGLTWEAMSAIETAIRENSQKYQFEFQGVAPEPKTVSA